MMTQFLKSNPTDESHFQSFLKRFEKSEQEKKTLEEKMEELEEFDDNQKRVLEDDHDKDFMQHGEAKDVIKSTMKRKRSILAEAIADNKGVLPFCSTAIFALVLRKFVMNTTLPGASLSFKCHESEVSLLRLSLVIQGDLESRK